MHDPYTPIKPIKKKDLGSREIPVFVLQLTYSKIKFGG